MKKTFTLTHPKKKPARVLDAIKSEVNKYIKRERGKKLPDGVDFWDFDCKVGANADEAKVIHLSEIPKSLDGLVDLESLYLEVIAKEGKRTKKPKKERVSVEEKPTTN